MQGTSVVASSGYGLGADIDWGNILKTGLDFGMEYYSAEQKASAMKADTERLQLIAKIQKAGGTVPTGDGETTQDGLFKGNTGLALGVGAVAVIGLGAFLFMGKRRR